jgi:hypothetical protein
MVVHLNKMGLATIEGIWYITYSICDLSHHLKKKCMLILMIQAVSNHIKENQLKLASSFPGSYFDTY